MELYLEPEANSACWSSPIETVYQSLPSGPRSNLAPKLPHLTDSDVLFLSGLVQIPRESRPHGIITWASEAFNLSRTSIYALGKRVDQKLFEEYLPRNEAIACPNRSEYLAHGQVVVVTPERMNRLILRTTFPGNVSIRPTQTVLEEAFGVRRSVGYISELRLEAGRRARQVLRKVDYSGIKYVQVGRDETFFHGAPVLMVIEPVSGAILLAEVCADRQADTWGAALQIVRDQGMGIDGLIEDMARNYEKSQKLADMSDAKVQKDTWHVMTDSAQLRTTLEKAAYRAMQKVLDLEKQLNKEWSEAKFDAYLQAVAAEAKAIEQYDAYAPLHGHLCDALEMVDWRSGEIRDPITAGWLLNATLDEMGQCTDYRILSFRKTLCNHQDYLLTFLEWLERGLLPWRNDLWLHFRNEDDVFAFERIVAQHWWCQQKLIANRKQWQSLADDVAVMLEHWTENSEAVASLASRLMQLFDAAGRTNSVTESINGLLKSFLNSRQSFQSTDSMQAYLDLFVLWHNTRIFERGKRQGKSPFQIAGVHTDSDDWIDLIEF